MLPEVGSTIVPPGLSSPSRSAASIIASPMRSFTEPPGFRYSSLARIVPGTSGEIRSSRTIGVPPTRSSTLGYSRAIAARRVLALAPSSSSSRPRPARPSAIAGWPTRRARPNVSTRAEGADGRAARRAARRAGAVRVPADRAVHEPLGDVTETQKRRVLRLVPAATASSVCLIAPSVMHRIQWRRRDKERLLRAANVLVARRRELPRARDHRRRLPDHGRALRRASAAAIAGAAAGLVDRALVRVPL